MRLIVNGDDLGYSPAVNESILDLYDRGYLNSTSVAANLPHFQSTIEQLSCRPKIKVGVHLNLTKGRPILAPSQIPTLVDRDRKFYPTPQFMSRVVAGFVSKVQVEAECTAQIERVADSGIPIAHLDSHSHWHFLPALREVIHRLAHCHRVSRIRQFSPRRTLLPNSPWLQFLPHDSQPPGAFFLTDYVFSLHHWLDRNGKPSPLLSGRALHRLLSNAAATVEMIVHVGKAEDPDFPQDTLPAYRRQFEFEFLQSEWFRKWLIDLNAIMM